MKFVKMHGCGNDYVYLDGVTDAALPARIDQPGWADLVKQMSDRHKGIGSDGVIVLTNPSVPEAHVRMRMFNADGSESEMCGNGVRCVAKFAHDRLGVAANPMLAQTGRGVLSIAYEAVAGKVSLATVDMGEPILELANIPVDESHITKARVGTGYSIHGFESIEDWRFVSMGNPHAVSFQLASILVPGHEIQVLDKYARTLERHAAFPNRSNIHIARSPSPSEADAFTWERGAGITQACGTGACAVLVAGVLSGRLNREADIHLLGGTLHIRWDEQSNHVFMTGPAEDICEGTWLDSTRQKTPAIQSQQLRTPHLILRPFTRDDAATVAQLAGDRRVAEMTLTVPHPYELHHALGWIASHEAHRINGTAAIMAVCEQSGQLVGAIGLEINPTHQRAELGYWIGPQFWGRGCATEASVEMLRYGFETLKLNRIFSCHFAANLASGRVLEKTGLKREGLAPRHVKRMGVVHDVVHFGLTREDWAAAQGAKG